MNVDPDNKQLEKLMRQAKTRKASERAAKNKKISAPMTIPADSNVSKELMDLQVQYRKTAKDYQIVQASIGACEKTLKVNQITIGELNEIPLEEERKMYRGVGKMFMMENKDQIFEHLKDEIKDNEKKISDYEQKKEYLERRITSQRQNIMECAGVK
jgi:prefoldin subunit 1